MFSLQQPASRRPNADRQELIDPDRRASFIWYGGIGPNPGDTFVLEWGALAIPLDIVSGLASPEGEESFTQLQFRSFGHSSYAGPKSGVSAVQVPTELRAEAELIAVEAALLFGSAWTGLTKPDGRYRFLHQDRYYRKSDFGYVDGAGVVALRPL